MRLIRKVKAIEVKRAFLMTNFLRKYGVAEKRDRKIPTKEKYLLARAKAHKAVKKLTEKQLDKLIGKEWKKRLTAYNSVNWYMGEIYTKEVGVWRKAGDLPGPWINYSLAYTAKTVKKALETNNKLLRKRARRVIPIIINLKDIIKKDKYSLSIVMDKQSSPVNRRWLKKMQWTLDDGNMRSIAFAISGDKKMKAYIGIKKKNFK